MRLPIAFSLLFFVLACISHNREVNAQAVASSLRPGQPVERTIKRGEIHSFSVSLKQDQFLQLVIDQRGIDVLVRVFSPDGKSLGEFDSPNGTSGPEGVSLIADASGLYRIEVSPLAQQENAASGRYEIKILDLRPATKEELDSTKNREVVRGKGLALLIEVADSLQQIRLPETRVRAQIQAAQLLWGLDEKRARNLVDEAIEGVNMYLANVDVEDQNYYQSYQTAMQLRNEVLMALAARDPELALGFLRSTSILTDPNAGQAIGQPNQELQLETSLASQIAVKDPKRALQIAQESLKKGYPYNLIDILNHLQANDPESAGKLANEMAAKLRGENLLKNPEAANLVINLLRMAASPKTNELVTASDAGASKPPLLTEQQYRDLFSMAVTAALSYTPPAANVYTIERNSAQSILTSLGSTTAEVERYAPGKGAAVGNKLIELNTPPDPQSRLMQQFQEAVNNGSLNAALEAVGQAPQELRQQLYQQIAVKAAEMGDFNHARQILMDHITNPFQRQQALKNIDQQAVQTAISSGKLEEAQRLVNNIRAPKERAMMLTQIVNQMGANQKRATLLGLLEQAHGLIGGSGRAEDQEQMNLLFEIVRAYLRLEPKRGLEILEPILDQFNEMSAAAMILNGFGQQFFQNGELMMQNGNSLGVIANELIQTLGTLAVADFDRAKGAADKVQRTEVRLATYLSIAQHTISNETDEGQGVITSRRH